MRYRLNAIDTFTSSDRIVAFHYLMFHGIQRQLDSNGGESIHRFGEDLSIPVRLTRNGRNMPDVFIPGTKMIVSDRVRQAIGPRKNISYSEVVFEKMIDYPYAAGDNSYYRTPEFLRNPNKNNPSSLFRRLPHRPDMVADTCPYWEIVVPVLASVAGAYRPTYQLICEPNDIDGELQLDLSPELLGEYCMFWDQCNFFDDSIYDAIKGFVDPDYFTINRYEFEIP